ncbi:MAG: hypothetical protein C0395_09840 [Gemmatimonas sp.]|nr:hypothetical protein [Gemmatimonas sp.]
MQLIAGLLLCGPASTAFALDDGGGRSVFATGAGNRALGLGGAFCAVADDASAAIWNPGGLGWIERKEVQATQTSLFGLGFNEQYAAVVVPDYRYGTASLVIRHFGVGGIESRDGRGVLLGDDLRDSETEIGLGFGRAINPALSVGGVLKMQRHTLADYSGSGYGIDVGLLALPLSLAGVREDGAGLTFGAVVRNLIEPKIRLDQESVPDPAAFRSGLAYRRDAGTGMALLASLDLEKTKHMDSRLHAGVQAELRNLFVLRLGSAAGNLTAGASVLWRDLGMDYQFEDNPLGRIHRIGLAVAFGPVVEESRRAARAAEAAALQDQLEAAFALRNEQQADRLIRDARAALSDGRWEETIDLVETLQVLAPDHAEVAPLASAAWNGQGRAQERAGDLPAAAVAYARALSANPQDAAAAADLERVRRESAALAERDREARERFESGLDAFSLGDLAAARATFTDLLALRPDDRDASVMLERTVDAIKRRAATQLDLTESMLAAGRCDDAATALAEALGLDPTAVSAASLAKRVERCRSAAAAATQAARVATPTQAASPAGTPAAPPLSKAGRRELADLYQRGVQALQDGRNTDAVHYWEMVWSTSADFEDVGDHLLREYLTLGMDKFANGQLEEALGYWERAVRVAPNDQRALGYLERAQRQKQRMESINAGR